MKRKLNVERMRRHQARSVSDRTVWRLDKAELSKMDAYEYEAMTHEYRQALLRKLIAKHGDNLVGVHIDQADALARHPDELVYVFTAKLRS